MEFKRHHFFKVCEERRERKAEGEGKGDTFPGGLLNFCGSKAEKQTTECKNLSD